MAKNTKSGLGRGLNSLLGGYEAAIHSARPDSSSDSSSRQQKESFGGDNTEKVKLSTNTMSQDEREVTTQTRSTEREVIREEDLSQEDRIVIDGEKKEYATNTQSPAEKITSKNAVNDVIAHEEYKEENDGVTIVNLVEREVGQSSQVSNHLHESISPLSQSSDTQALGELDNQNSTLSRATDEVSINMVRPNPNQPRMHFNKEELQELASSIAKDGLLQPILVRKVATGYEIIAGERRWQACKLAGLETVPVRIKEADDIQVLELALIENLQRSDLNPIEEAYGYKQMMERGGRTQSEVATAVSKGRSTIANALRLLDLPEEAQQLLYEEKITAGHARAILSIPTEEGRKKLTEKLKNEKLSVRETESIARLFTGRAKTSSHTEKAPIPQWYKTTAKTLSTQLETKVRIRSNKGKNKLEIEFKNEEDLRRVLKQLHESTINDLE